MKVMVCLKQVPHQDARLDIREDGTWIKEDSIKFEINTYDTYALEEALRLKDSGEAEVVVVSVGPDRVTQALRTALGMGADRAIHINDPAAASWDNPQAQFRRHNPDIWPDPANLENVGPYGNMCFIDGHVETGIDFFDTFSIYTSDHMNDPLALRWWSMTGQ